MTDTQPLDPTGLIAELVAKARQAQRAIDAYDQTDTDLLTAAAGWAIIEPGRNRRLAERAVADTGLGDIDDKISKNYRKTLGLLDDLHGAKSVGVIAQLAHQGITEIARPVGVVAAITPSTNPAATPANKIINALKGKNAIILAPSPKAWATAQLLVDFVHSQFNVIGAPHDLVQLLPEVDKALTRELMRQADLVVATGSQANIREAYRSGTPAFGVGAGNVACIVDRSADLGKAASLVAYSKTFDHATSCSSENSLIIDAPIYQPMLSALAEVGGVLLDAPEKEQLQAALFEGNTLAPHLICRNASTIAERVGLTRNAIRAARFLMIEESGVGVQYPFSGEKLAPIITLYRSRDFDDACRIVAALYAFQGAGHSVGLHSLDDSQAVSLGLRLPVARVIVNQAHCVATGGSFDNGLPFSLSMGCGTWGRNSFSDNLNYRHYLNITRVARVIAERVPREEAIFASFFLRGRQ
jgi:sulfoacetaldehyde dehydrogenase